MEKRSQGFGGQLCQAAQFLLCLFILGMVAITSQANAMEKKLRPEQMPLLERQSWALAMLERLNQANRVILDPEYVTLQRKRFEKLAQPFVLGTSPKETRKTVQSIRDEVEKSERIAIEHLDRQFRQTLDRTFQRKSDLTLRQQWFEGWQKTVQVWQKSVDRTDRLSRLISWLQQSNTTLKGKHYTTITPVPLFSGTAVAKKAKTPTTPVVPLDKRRTPPEIPPGLAVDPSETRPLPSRHVARKPVAPSKTKPLPRPQSARPALDINLPELAAQISGNNLALRRLEAKLVTSKRWDADQIDPSVVQMKQIATRLTDTQMIYRLLSPQQQRQVDKIADPAAAIKTLRSKILAARIAALENHDSSTSLTKEQRVELQHLDRLSNDLDSITRRTKKSPPSR